MTTTNVPSTYHNHTFGFKVSWLLFLPAFVPAIRMKVDPMLTLDSCVKNFWLKSRCQIIFAIFTPFSFMIFLINFNVPSFGMFLNRNLILAYEFRIFFVANGKYRELLNNHQQVHWILQSSFDDKSLDMFYPSYITHTYWAI